MLSRSGVFRSHPCWRNIRAPVRVSRLRQGLSGSAARLIMVILVFGVGNVLLVGGQKLLHSKDQSRLDEIHRQLDTEKTDIDRLEAQIGSDDGVLSNLDA